jgi:hypothetical protein
MDLSRALCVGLLVLLIFITACGSGGGSLDPNFPNNVTVTVSPSAVTIPANGQVTLQATVKGSPINTVSSWTITELKINGASGAQCNWLGTTPPVGSCPDGTIQGADTPQFPVTYHAPSTSGTFHVIAEWAFIGQPPVNKDATAVITVSP